MLAKLLFRIAFIFPFVLNSQICNNINFEAGNFSGWTIKSGTTQVLQSNQTMTTCCGTAGSPEALIMTTPFPEPYAGYLPHSPLGGTKVARLNDSDATTINLGLITRISYPIAVTPSTNLQYAISGYVTGLSHPCDDYAYANVRLKDGSGTVFYVNQLMDYSGSTACGNSAAFTNTITSHGLAYFCWQTYSVNLTPYIGQNITLEVTAGDCTGWGHAGYCYFDATCSVVTPTMLPCGLSTGLNDVVAEEIVNVWPNPVKDKLQIKTSAKESSIVIYDVLGKEILRKSDLKETEEIRLEKFEPGVYFYRFFIGKQQYQTDKLIKE